MRKISLHSRDIRAWTESEDIHPLWWATMGSESMNSCEGDFNTQDGKLCGIRLKQIEKVVFWRNGLKRAVRNGTG